MNGIDNQVKEFREVLEMMNPAVCKKYGATGWACVIIQTYAQKDSVFVEGAHFTVGDITKENLAGLVASLLEGKSCV